MPHPTKPSNALAKRLASLFGDDIACPTAILAVLASGERNFTPQELVEATDHRLIDVMVAVARLTAGGLIAHPSVGQYKALDTQRSRRAG